MSALPYEPARTVARELSSLINTDSIGNSMIEAESALQTLEREVAAATIDPKFRPAIEFALRCAHEHVLSAGRYIVRARGGSGDQ